MANNRPTMNGMVRHIMDCLGINEHSLSVLFDIQLGLRGIRIDTWWYANVIVNGSYFAGNPRESDGSFHSPEEALFQLMKQVSDNRDKYMNDLKELIDVELQRK